MDETTKPPECGEEGIETASYSLVAENQELSAAKRQQKRFVQGTKDNPSMHVTGDRCSQKANTNKSLLTPTTCRFNYTNKP
jgi:hypothetical protein